MVVIAKDVRLIVTIHHLIPNPNHKLINAPNNPTVNLNHDLMNESNSPTANLNHKLIEMSNNHTVIPARDMVTLLKDMRMPHKDMKILLNVMEILPQPSPPAYTPSPATAPPPAYTPS